MPTTTSMLVLFRTVNGGQPSVSSPLNPARSIPRPGAGSCRGWALQG